MNAAHLRQQEGNVLLAQALRMPTVSGDSTRACCMLARTIYPAVHTCMLRAREHAYLDGDSDALRRRYVGQGSDFLRVCKGLARSNLVRRRLVAHARRPVVQFRRSRWGKTGERLGHKNHELRNECAQPRTIVYAVLGVSFNKALEWKDGFLQMQHPNRVAGARAGESTHDDNDTCSPSAHTHNRSADTLPAQSRPRSLH